MAARGEHGRRILAGLLGQQLIHPTGQHLPVQLSGGFGRNVRVGERDLAPAER
jgi:hypothetical protein